MYYRKRLKIKALSLVLALFMLVPSVPILSAQAETEQTQNSVSDNISQTVTDTDTSISSENTVTENMTLDLSTVPDIVGTEKALEAGHIERMYEDEQNLYSVIFRNDDGTKTAYYYDHPVKYVDADGSVKDITLDIEASDTVSGAFVSKDTLTQTSFPEKMTDGISLTDGDVSLKLVPVFDTAAGGLTPITPITPITPVTPGISTSGIISGEDTYTSAAVSPRAELTDSNSVVYEYDSSDRNRE